MSFAPHDMPLQYVIVILYKVYGSHIMVNLDL